MRDDFFWLNTINRATVVVGCRNKQFDETLARRAARGIKAVEAAGRADPSKRVKKYIAWEPMFIAAAGPEVTVIHAGRSSQDILSTVRAAMLRDDLLEFAGALEDVIGALLELARRHRDTIVPSYTNGVAAQPTSYGHTLSAVAASLLRTRVRVQQTLEAFDACAMGSTVLNGTCWPLDRAGMARTLGFARPVANALDATSMSPVDFPLQAASCAAEAAVRIGSMINDIMVQYAQPRPWILLREGGENTYVSSAMPQKRNPGLMNNCREDCSDVIGAMMTAFTRAHNVVPGMVDGKSTDKNGRMMASAVAMLKRFSKVLAGLVISPERALEELNSDWTASQEIADRLMRDHGLPFRIGHHVASRMVGWARANNVLPLAFPYEEFERIYREEIQEEFPEGDPKLPMSREEFQAALDPRSIVRNRATAGSCAPAEVDRLIDEAQKELSDLASQRTAQIERIDAALAELNTAFETLL